MEPSPHDLEESGGAQLDRPLNLYEEADDMLLNAFLMFCIPDIRTLARQGLLEGDAEILRRIVDLPATLEDVVNVYEDNIELLTKELKSKERAQMYEETLTLKKYNLDEETRKERWQNIFLIHFEDSTEESECVYCISLNNVSKRVGIFFRGSVTKQDLRRDVKAVLSRIDNPVKADHLAEKLEVHLGFKEYLYNEERLGAKAGNEERTTKKLESEKKTPPRDYLCNEERPIGAKAGNEERTTKKLESEKKTPPFRMKYQIILEQVRELFNDHPDYRLYIAGHSLGGALTTLMALEAGADEAIPKPVTAITSGAPKVGNLDFLKAFEELERQKKLRFLQIANDRDVVTLSPPDQCSPCFAMFFQSRRYRHVGLTVQLRSNGYIVIFPPQMRTYLGVLLCDCMYISRTWMYAILIGFGCVFWLFACPLVVSLLS